MEIMIVVLLSYRTDHIVSLSVKILCARENTMCIANCRYMRLRVSFVFLYYFSLESITWLYIFSVY